MKFFFAHSHENHDFVKAVAKEVGRPLVILDEYSFETGKTFRALMRDYLAKSDVFVLFATAEALRRPAVEFEVQEAEDLALSGRFKRVLVFLLDPDLSFASLPKWLSLFNGMRATNVKQCAKEILHHYAELTSTSLVFGRDREAEELVNDLMPGGGAPRPHAFVVYGYPGMGRRTLIAKVAKEALDFTKTSTFHVGVGDGLLELSALLADDLGIVRSEDDLAQLLSVVDSAELIRNCVAHLATLCEQRTLPILVDEGGLVDGDGSVPPWVAGLLSRIGASSGTYLGIVSRRTFVETKDESALLPQRFLEGLKPVPMERYLTKLCEVSSLPVRPQEIVALRDFVAGYPPAATYAVRLAKMRGMALVLQEKETLIEFRVSVFLRLLERDRQLTPERRAVLATLWLYGPIPVTAIAAGMSCDTSAMGEHLGYLLDCALVVPTDVGYYEIAEPLRDAVDRVLSNERVNHAGVRDALYSELAVLDDGDHRLSLRNSWLRAKISSGEMPSAEAQLFGSELFRLARRAYDAQDYEHSLAVLEMALRGREDNVEFLQLRARALIKLERDEEASDSIELIRSAGHVRQAHFLKGFQLRNREQYSEAISEFEEAMRRGMRSVAVHREIADAYYRTKQLTKAEEHINIAQQRDRDNRYIVDLQVQIATALDKEDIARKRLATLRVVDRFTFFLYRKALVELHFGHLDEAYKDAKEAVNLLARPPYAHLALLARLEIYKGKLNDAAGSLNRLSRSTRKKDRDIERLLRSQWEARSGKIESALSLLGRKPFGRLASWNHVRFEVLSQALREFPSDDPRRGSMEEEIELLSRSDRDYDLDVPREGADSEVSIAAGG